MSFLQHQHTRDNPLCAPKYSLCVPLEAKRLWHRKRKSQISVPKMRIFFWVQYTNVVNDLYFTKEITYPAYPKALYSNQKLTGKQSKALFLYVGSFGKKQISTVNRKLFPRPNIFLGLGPSRTRRSIS